MKSESVRLILVCSCMAVGSALSADPGNPYLTISARNAFGLRPPPPPAPPPQAPVQRPVPTLALTGVADFVHQKWAFVTRTDPGKPPNKYTLSPGETQGGLHLVDLNAASAMATLIVDGSETVTLRLVAATNTPPPPKAPNYTHLSRTRVLPPLPRR